MKTTGPSPLELAEPEAKRLWDMVGEILSAYRSDADRLPVQPRFDGDALRTALSEYDFDKPRDPVDVIRFIDRHTREHQIHTRNRRYFGLFEPAASTLGVLAESLVAGFNPQLAAWIGSPFGVELEQHLLRSFARALGLRGELGGTLTTGGAEANMTALQVALHRACPTMRDGGLRALERQPVVFISDEGHHSFLKACRFSGLGTHALRRVAVDGALSMRVEALKEAIGAARAAGEQPVLIVGTAGTTAGGGIDPLRELAAVARREGMWFHVDAAWGGCAALVPEFKHLVDGIGEADSVTLDAHKALAAPMGAGMFLTNSPAVMQQAFGVTTTYVPPAPGDHLNPYTASMQWSRRFAGLKVFLPLAAVGWAGLAGALRTQFELGRTLKAGLLRDGWDVVNASALPLVCFRNPVAQTDQAQHLDAIAADVIASGRAWLSRTVLRGDQAALRACICNHRATEDDIVELLSLLAAARHRQTG